jgi:hypothetical protein
MRFIAVLGMASTPVEPSEDVGRMIRAGRIALYQGRTTRFVRIGNQRRVSKGLDGFGTERTILASHVQRTEE